MNNLKKIHQRNSKLTLFKKLEKMSKMKYTRNVQQSVCEAVRTLKSIFYEFYLIVILTFFHRMGAHKKRGNDRTAQDFTIQRIIMHESYKRPYGLSNDIALLKLNKPAQINNYVGLACLPDSSTPSLPIDNMSKKCWITGT